MQCDRKQSRHPARARPSAGPGLHIVTEALAYDSASRSSRRRPTLSPGYSLDSFDVEHIPPEDRRTPPQCYVVLLVVTDSRQTIVSRQTIFVYAARDPGA
jgi:hypothetical protein